MKLDVSQIQQDTFLHHVCQSVSKLCLTKFILTFFLTHTHTHHNHHLKASICQRNISVRLRKPSVPLPPTTHTHTHTNLSHLFLTFYHSLSPQTPSTHLHETRTYKTPSTHKKSDRQYECNQTVDGPH